MAVYAPGMWRRLPVLVGGAIGYVAYLIGANMLGYGTPIDFAKIGQAAWFGLPTFQSPVFNFTAMSLIAPVAIILVAENLGHIKAIGAMTGRNLDPYLGRAFMGDGLATMLSGASGGTGMTTYAENMGVMAVTRIYSTRGVSGRGRSSRCCSGCRRNSAPSSARFRVPFWAVCRSWCSA